MWKNGYNNIGVRRETRKIALFVTDKRTHIIHNNIICIITTVQGSY